MSHDPLTQGRFHKAAEVCQHFELSAEAKALLQEDLAPQQFLDLLIVHAQFLDATRLLAHALPKREAIWWACLCVRRELGNKARPEDTAALEAAEKWVVRPDEDNRRAAMPTAETTEFSTAASWAAVAAFWSGGSIAPPNVPAVPPGEYLTAKAVSGAVMLAAVASEPEKAPEKYKTFFAQAMAIAAGTNRWPEP